MFRKLIAVVLAGTFFAFSWIASARLIHAQTPTPASSRDALIQSIQETAQRDVKMGKDPASASDLGVLFSSDASRIGVSMTEVAGMYDEEYRKALGAKPWWEVLMDYLFNSGLGCWTTIILSLVLVFHEAIKDILSRKFTEWIESSYRRLSGLPPLWSIALQRYRKALDSAYRELKITFRPGHPLRMSDIYVPLRVSGTSTPETLDAYQEIQKYRCLVVVGEPGSGKSMLLRHMAYTYANRGLNDFPRHPIPVLLELNRLNNSDAPLIDHLSASLKQHNFPNASAFLEVALKSGQLLLLLDGLDEIGSQYRDAAVTKIKDLLLQYKETQAVITCRTQVYRDEFCDLADQKLEIVQFNDHQIQRFLAAWEKDMPKEEGKSIEHFLFTLQDRPRIMSLARNPLLLTMIAYLYTDTSFELPHSRTEFYDRSTRLLLEQWHSMLNRYKDVQKRLVLQRLALSIQSDQSGGDRRSIEYIKALSIIQEVLPSLTISEQEAQSMLCEIVERSGLLMMVDGGARCQFSHMTLQEYFAAQALLSKPKDLLDCFGEDRDVWREVIRHWCGQAHDSTALIRKVYKIDPFLAFECLADAQQVDPSYVDKLIEQIKGMIIVAGQNESFARAMSMVAADPRRHGTQLFDFLKDCLSSADHRLIAADILSRTSLPKAAETLAKRVVQYPELRPFLSRLGDLAVPSLSIWAGQGEDWALDALRMIGTSKAALALVPNLWHKQEVISFKTAWRLASIIRHANIEASLRSHALTPEQRREKWIDWIWHPFNEPPYSSLAIITGRIAYLLDNAPDDTVPQGDPFSLDPRIVIPLCTILAKDSLEMNLSPNRSRILFEYMKDDLSSPSRLKASPESIAKREADNRRVINLVFHSPRIKYLLRGSPLSLQDSLLSLIYFSTHPTPTPEDWRNVFHHATYIFEKSSQSRIARLLLLLVCSLNLLGTANYLMQSVQPITFYVMVAALWGLLMLFAVWRLVRFPFTLDMGLEFVRHTFLVLGPAIGGVLGIISGDPVVGISAGAVAGAVSCALGTLLLDEVDHPVRNTLFGCLYGMVGGAISVSSGLGVMGVIVGAFIGGLLGTITILESYRWDSNRVVFILSNIPLLGGVSMVISLLIFLPTTIFHVYGGWSISLLFWAMWMILTFALFLDGKRKARRTKNPLFGLIVWHYEPANLLIRNLADRIRNM